MIVTQQEYDEVIKNIILDGRGYTAIADIIQLLSNLEHNRDRVLVELKNDRIATKKILNGKESNKVKIETLKGLFV